MLAVGYGESTGWKPVLRVGPEDSLAKIPSEPRRSRRAGPCLEMSRNVSLWPSVSTNTHRQNEPTATANRRAGSELLRLLRRRKQLSPQIAAENVGHVRLSEQPADRVDSQPRLGLEVVWEIQPENQLPRPDLRGQLLEAVVA